MPQFSAEAISRFEDLLRKDPNSQVFASLAEAYRADGRFPEAERVAVTGVNAHPNFAAGWVVYGRTLRDLSRPAEATKALKRALTLSPENFLALHLLGELQMEDKKPKEALQTFKRILFLNPLAEKAKQIVAKLESLTADEYGDDLFAMTKLAPLGPKGAGAPSEKAKPAAGSKETPKGLLRMMSLIDAFIVRNDLVRAGQLVDETKTEYGDHAEIQKRQLMLQKRRASQLANAEEEADDLQPLSSREDQIRRKKLEVLQGLLSEIQVMKGAEV